MSLALTLDNILHELVTISILAASVFVKNANSQANASKLITLAAELLPVADAALNPGNPTSGVVAAPKAGA